MRQRGALAADEHRRDPRAAVPLRSPTGHLRDHLPERLQLGRRIGFHLGSAGPDRVLHPPVTADRPVAGDLDAAELGGGLHSPELLDQQLPVRDRVAGEVAQPRPAVAPEGNLAVVVRRGPGGRGVDVEQSPPDVLHRVGLAGVLEVDVDPVDAGDGLGMLLLDRRHHQGAVAGAEDKRDRPLGRDVVEAGEVGDSRRVEDDQRVETGGVHPRPDRLPAKGELAGGDPGRFQ